MFKSEQMFVSKSRWAANDLAALRVICTRANVAPLVNDVSLENTTLALLRPAGAPNTAFDNLLDHFDNYPDVK